MERNGSGLEESLVSYSPSDQVVAGPSVGLKKRIFLESKLLWRVAAPSVATRLSLFSMYVITQAFIGHIGSTELAAYALVQTVISRFVNGILLGMGSALETFCGQAFGAKQYTLMGIYMQRSWIVLFVTTTILIPIFTYATPILFKIGQTQEISQMAGPIALWFIPVNYYFVFNYTFQMFLQAQMKNAIIGWLAIASLLVHILLSWVMVDKLGLGINGAMASLVISCWLSVIGQFIYVFGGWCSQTWTGFSMAAFKELGPVVKLSLSSGVMLCLELWYNSILVLLAGYMKDAEVSISAFSICLNILAWELMISLGFLAAASVRVSNELGRGNTKAVKFAIKVVSVTSVLIGVVFFIIFMSLGGLISYAFTSSTVVEKAVDGLKVLLSFSILLNSLQPVLSGVALGAGWQSIVAYVNIGCYYVIGIPLGVVLGYVAHLGINGIWIGMICGVALQTIALIIITVRTDWDLQVEKAKARVNKWSSSPVEKETEEDA